MSEQVTEDKGTEEKKSVVLPLAAGGLAGWGTKHLYSNAANKLALDALAPEVAAPAAVAEGAAAPAAKTIAPELRKEARAAAEGSKNANNLRGAAVLREEGRIAGIQSARLEKLADNKGYKVHLNHPSGHGTTLTVDKLTGEAGKLLGDKTGVDVVGKELEQLTKGGEKSWVATTANAAEKSVAKSIRGNAAYKEAAGGLIGTVGKTFSHAGGLSKAGIIGGSVLATVGIVTGVKRMFSSHTERAAATQSTGTAPTR